MAGYVRSNDPLAAFGYTLQQRGVTLASFDPASLNYPAPVTNWNGGFVAEVPLINVDAWYGRAAASSAAAAATSERRVDARGAPGWTSSAPTSGPSSPASRPRTLVTAAKAARAHVRQAESMVANGMATRSDALLASVQAGQVDAQLIGATGEARIARQRLAVLLGQPGDTTFTLPDSLPSAATIRALSPRRPGPDSAGARLDVTAAQLGVEAAQRDVRRATAKYLPRLNGFGRYDWNSPDQPFGGQGSYTVGIMASWSPFSGASEIAARQEARGRAEAASAGAEAADADAPISSGRPPRTQSRGGPRPPRHRRDRGRAGRRGASHRGPQVRRRARHRRRAPFGALRWRPRRASHSPNPATRSSSPTLPPGRRPGAT